MTRWLRWTGGLLVLVALALATLIWLNLRGEPLLPAPSEIVSATPQQIAQGAYLARAGNCAACHTARGGAAYAGGLGIETPFGTVYTSNLTPDGETGLGQWSAAAFWRAMHHGQSRDGHLLYPAFPYTSYTLVSREDSDALFAYLQSLTPVSQRNQSHRLIFPYNTQAALAVWRTLFFRPTSYAPLPAKDPAWNRGAYLVRGLGHCAACHAPRNLLGATTDPLALRGGMIPMLHWYAPSLASAEEAGVSGGNTQDVVDLLKNGVSPRGAVLGPMAEVVFRSTQYLLDADLQAIAVYLRDLPAPRPEPPPAKMPETSAFASGEKVYARHCAECHGERGEGASGAYPALAGNRAVSMATPANLIQIVLHGGYPPATSGNPRPYGMPPMRLILDDAEIASVLTYIRRAWGQVASPVSVLDVMQNQ